MKSNVGGADRAVRIVAGLLVLALGLLFLEGAYRWWALVGLVPLVTGLAGWCPLYPLVGLDTCPARR